MNGEKFTLMQYSISAVLGLIEAEDFVIPKFSARSFGKKAKLGISSIRCTMVIPQGTL